MCLLLSVFVGVHRTIYARGVVLELIPVAPVISCIFPSSSLIFLSFKYFLIIFRTFLLIPRSAIALSILLHEAELMGSVCPMSRGRRISLSRVLLISSLAHLSAMSSDCSVLLSSLNLNWKSLRFYFCSSSFFNSISFPVESSKQMGLYRLGSNSLLPDFLMRASLAAFHFSGYFCCFKSLVKKSANSFAYSETNILSTSPGMPSGPGALFFLSSLSPPLFPFL